ncbi:ATP-binding cassette domain-containing protein [Salmonella enterica subsp. enterica]|nr:ATP-binding cassette domain-containing protein [Salmonella enterica subsp. enterica]
MASVQLRKCNEFLLATWWYRKILTSISMTEFVVSVGPSGCGKSTLLRMIAGLKPSPVATCLSWGNPYDIPPAERGVGMVFQSYALYPHLRCRKHAPACWRAPKVCNESTRQPAAEVLHRRICWNVSQSALGGSVSA